MKSLAVLGRRTARALRDVARFHRHLENGVGVWVGHKFKRPIQPLRFRSGTTWHHGARDDPVLIFREIFIENFYEKLNAPADAHILDIGANIGALTLFWAAGRPDLHFCAYEPNPESYATLRKNVDANRLATQVDTYPEAIGRTRGNLNLWVDISTPFTTAYGPAPFEGARKLPVPMITLDDAWKRIGREPIWMLKIDTEGAEGDILEGASDAVLASTQNACIEWHNDIVPGVFTRCRDRLTAAGFKIRTREHPWDQGIFFASRA